MYAQYGNWRIIAGTSVGGVLQIRHGRIRSGAGRCRAGLFSFMGSIARQERCRRRGEFGGDNPSARILFYVNT